MRALAMVTVCVALLAACGGDDDNPTPTSTAAPPATSTAIPPAPSPAATAVISCPPVQTTGLAQLLVSSAPQGGEITLDDVSVATFPCFDRITFQWQESNYPGFQIRYVTGWTACGSGNPVTTAGSAQIAVTLDPAVAHDQNGNVTVPSLNLAPAYPSIQEARQTCDFEGEVSWVIGTELRFFTVDYLAAPTRLVIDVYH
ncbi:MAG: hypothetical protein HY873_03510 [Chloroflexi bacterium]|nr:hypothetical protein [Chloroflexota bacterium]